MLIQVLGSGCPSCKKLHDMTVKIAKELHMTEKVEYLTGDVGTSKIIELGIMSSPVLLVNNIPVVVGFIPDVDKLKTIIQKAM